MKVIIDSAIPYIRGVVEPYAEVVYCKGAEIDRSVVADADALIVRTRTQCNAALLEGSSDESRHQCFELFTRLMRLSYNDRHLELFEWADDLSALTRESQRQFFLHSVRLLRESYMIHAGLGSISYLWGEEADFCRKFAPYIGNQNIEFLVEEIERAMMQIMQNGAPRIVFTHFALAVSKQINRLQ